MFLFIRLYLSSAFLLIPNIQAADLVAAQSLELEQCAEKNQSGLNLLASCFYPRAWQRIKIKDFDPRHLFRAIYKIPTEDTLVIDPRNPSTQYATVIVEETGLTFSCWREALVLDKATASKKTKI